MIILKCDKCGEIYGEECNDESGIELQIKDKTEFQHSYDIIIKHYCNKCGEMFLSFLKDGWI